MPNIKANKRLAWAALALGLSLGMGLAACGGLADQPPQQAEPGQGWPLKLRAATLVLNPEDRQQTKVGRLIYRGGLELSSSDRRFGGLSGLLVSDDGRNLLAISDKGWWVAAELFYKRGRLSGLGRARLGRLRGLAGEYLAGKKWSDAEELARGDGASVIITFERHHRLWRYGLVKGVPNGRPEPMSPPAWLSGLPPNQGPEALTRLADGRYLLLAEWQPKGDYVPAALSQGKGWQKLHYLVHPDFLPTAAATLPGGDVLVLERYYSTLTGVAARVVIIERSQLAPGAKLRTKLLAFLKPPVNVDNFEGLDARRSPNGKTLIYLISDDNFSPLQRTLLMMFELSDKP